MKRSGGTDPASSFDQPCGVDQDQHIGWAVVSFTLEALEKHFVFCFQYLDGDAGILSFELAIELFVRVVVASRIHTKSDLLLGVCALMRGAQNQA